jgi:peptidoglycan-associated lipoprotein
MTEWRIRGAALAAALVLAGCSARGSLQDQGGTHPASRHRPFAAGPDRSGADGGYGSTDSFGAEGQGGQGGESVAAVPAQRIIYFLYDSDEILPEYQPVVSAHAAYLAANPGREAVLEGHADERGSPEYNIALAERRAKAVQRALQLKGGADGQSRVVSYGEEKPADPGHDEAAYDHNRRVEISYSSR